MNGLSSSITGGDVSRRDFLLTAGSAGGIGSTYRRCRCRTDERSAALAGRDQRPTRPCCTSAPLTCNSIRKNAIANRSSRRSRPAWKICPVAVQPQSCVDQLLILQAWVRGEYLRGEFVRVAGWSLSRPRRESMPLSPCGRRQISRIWRRLPLCRDGRNCSRKLSALHGRRSDSPETPGSRAR